MKPAPFDYVAPRSLDEAVAALAEGGTDAKLLAGGQSLIPLLNFRLARPALLVDLNRVAELAYVRPRNRGTAIGAMTRQATIERDRALSEKQPLLAEAIRWVGHAAMRSRGRDAARRRQCARACVSRGRSGAFGDRSRRRHTRHQGVPRPSGRCPDRTRHPAGARAVALESASGAGRAARARGHEPACLSGGSRSTSKSMGAHTSAVSSRACC